MNKMIKNRMRFLFGIAFAPLFILYVIPLVNCLLSFSNDDSKCVAGISGFTWYGLPIAGIAIIISLPLIYLFIIKKWTGAIHFGLGGALISVILAGLIIILDSSLESLAVFSSIVAMGIITALLFWGIAIRGNIGNKESE